MAVRSDSKNEANVIPHTGRLRKKTAGKPSTSQRASEDWFREAFAEDYLWLYAHRNEREAARQVAAAVRLVPFAKGQKILDIACGAGRHMVAFARRGARVTGIDLSYPLVRQARQRLKQAGIRAAVRHGDMRQLTDIDRFDGATIWFTSLGYFPTVAEDREVVRRLARALKSGGWWWIDLANPAFLENNLVAHSERICPGPHGRAEVTEDRSIMGDRVVKRIQVKDRAGRRFFQESVRLYRPERFASLIRAAGLTADGILGDYDGQALTRYTPRQIWYGRKFGAAE